MKIKLIVLAACAVFLADCTADRKSTTETTVPLCRNDAGYLLNKCRDHDVSSCEEYAKWYQYGSEIKEVEQIIWEDCKRDRDFSTCERYMKYFPNGTYSREAKKRMKEQEVASAADRKTVRSPTRGGEVPSGCSSGFMNQCARLRSGEKPATVFNTLDSSELKDLLGKCLDCLGIPRPAD